MKKIVFTLSIAIVATSCGMPEGGNKGVIKKEEGVVRYDDANAEKNIDKLKRVKNISLILYISAFYLFVRRKHNASLIL